MGIDGDSHLLKGHQGKPGCPSTKPPSGFGGVAQANNLAAQPSPNPAEQPSPWDDLPTGILPQIFAFLSSPKDFARSQCVAKKWCTEGKAVIEEIKKTISPFLAYFKTDKRTIKDIIESPTDGQKEYFEFLETNQLHHNKKIHLNRIFSTILTPNQQEAVNDRLQWTTIPINSQHLWVGNLDVQDQDDFKADNITHALRALALGADPNLTYNGNTALSGAAFNGHTEIVKALIEAGADVDHANNYGDTALIKSARCGHIETVKALIEASANVNQANKHGETALQWATSLGYTDIVKALINAGANVDQANDDGDTALIQAATCGYIEIVKDLINAKANVDRANNDGYTALIQAAEIGHTDTVKALVKASAKLDYVDSNGKTALAYAKDKNNREIVKILKKAGPSMFKSFLKKSAAAIKKKP